jgi:Tol biopolymer transport system component
MRVFVRPVGGGRPIPLSDDTTAFEEQPRWTPDGTQLLFISLQGVHVAQAFGGGGAARLVFPRRLDLGGTAAWSPDGKEIAFVTSDDSLVRVKIDGSASRFLRTGDKLSSCDWSRDGKWIACASGNMVYSAAGAFFGNLAPSALVLIPAEGGAPIPLTDAVAMNHSPVWADDGRRLLFISDRDGPRDIYELAITPSGTPAGPPVRLSAGLNAHSVSVSALAHRVAYAVYTPRSNVWSIPIPAGDPVSADAATPVTSGNQVVENMSVSQDGQWLVYDTNISGNGDLYRIPASGGASRRLTSEPFAEFAGTLSADGTRLAYHAFRTPGLRQVEVRPTEGGPVERMTPAPDQQVLASWSPDGKAIAFFAQDPPLEGWIIRQSEPGAWGAPVRRCACVILGWVDERTIVVGSVALAEGSPGLRIATHDVASGAERVVFERPFGPDMPQGGTVSADRRSLIYKTADPSGRPSIWIVPVSGGTPRLLVRFTNPDRPSYRAGIAASQTHLYFTIDDRQSDIAVAELTRR